VTVLTFRQFYNQGFKSLHLTKFIVQPGTKKRPEGAYFRYILAGQKGWFNELAQFSGSFFGSAEESNSRRR
jgi:hypothetical protein